MRKEIVRSFPVSPRRLGLLFLWGVLGLLALGAVACGDDDEEEAAPTAAPAAAVAPSPTATTAPVAAPKPAPTPKPVAVKKDEPLPGGTLRIAGRDLENFEPNIRGQNALSPISITYDTLTHYKRDDPLVTTDYTPFPELAESWDIVDPQTIVFHLRQGVKFHNIDPTNGREVVADDVVFSFQRHITPGTLEAPGMGPLTDITALDDATVQVDFDKPYAPFMTSLGQAQYRIYAPEVLEEFGSYETFESLIGTGQYIADKYEKGISMVFTKNPDYFRGPNGVTGENLPYIDTIKVFMATDEATRLAMYRAGQLDTGPIYALWGGFNTNQDVMDAVKDRPDLTASNIVADASAFTTYHFQGKVDEPPFSNKKIRQAVALINDISCQAWCWVTGSVLPSREFAVSHPWYVPVDELSAEAQELYANFPDSTIDVERAKQLLKEGMVELGLDPNQPLKTKITVANYEQGLIDTAERLSSDWKKIGIDATINVIPLEQLNNEVLKGEYEGAVFDYGRVYFDPDPLFSARYYSTSPGNVQGINDPVLDALIDAGKIELDPEKRKKIYQDIQKHLAPLAYTWLVPNYTKWSIFPEYLKGIGPYIGSNIADQYLNAWFTEDAPSR